jgi:hypothetical protein
MNGSLQMGVKVDDTDWAILAETCVRQCSRGRPFSIYRLIERNNGKVIVWSPPSVIKRGSVLPLIEGPGSPASVWGGLLSSWLWPSSICCSA